VAASRGGLGAAALRSLAARHGIRPSKSLGQHFLVDPNVARLVASLADIGPDDRVIEIGAGLGSLTVTLAARGARVLAVEFDRRLVPALEDAVAASRERGPGEVEILVADATALDWGRVLGDRPGDPWTLCSNLPYNIATPLLLDVLELVPAIERLVVMVQREVGERLVARPGDEGFGAVSLKVAYRAEAEILRRVPPTVFWPTPGVESVIVRLDRVRPPVASDPGTLFRVIEEGFAQRRKTLRTAVRRLGLDTDAATGALRRAGIAPAARAEELDLASFARLADVLEAEGTFRDG
jgi:16S rRNA (adenine1518-N6/adenine1519-N6)-dimethyltransferase